MTADGISDRDLYLSQGPGLFGALVGVLLLIAYCAAVWALVHPLLVLRPLRRIYLRGRAYRRRLRAARHRRTSLHHLTFRKAPLR